MAISPSILLVELIMSADRLVQSSQSAASIEGQWTPSVVLGHLSQVDEQVWGVRIDQMVDALEAGSNPPAFTWWEPDPVETENRYSSYTLEAASAELMAGRTRLLTRLRALTEAQWQATGVHDVFGELDISTLLIEVLRHDEEHRATLVL